MPHSSVSASFAVAAVLNLAACSEPADRVPSQQEMDAFTNKLEADVEAGRNAAIADAQLGEVERAAEAEDRLTESERNRGSVRD
jgi:hypothetical protein